ncbi:hypothetical protein GQ44DRAFT_464376 [Phaeosphaeriaceae sp. PMI808]|nr:hypothetical protein GQ44DRAFT_464376 [Phaeosphaeriaceae sp. PMI808]
MQSSWRASYKNPTKEAYNELVNALSVDEPKPTDTQKPHLSNSVTDDEEPILWAVDFNRNRVFHDRFGFHRTFEFSLPETGSIINYNVHEFQDPASKLIDVMDPLLRASIDAAQKSMCLKAYKPMGLSPKLCPALPAKCSFAAAPRDVIPQSLYDPVFRITADYQNMARDRHITPNSFGFTISILACLH